MQKPYVVTGFLIPADQDTPEAVHPTLRPFYDPPPGFDTRLLLERLGFFAACTDMGGAADLLPEVPDLLIVIAFLQAQPLWRVGSWLWPFHGNARDSRSGHFAIMAIRAVHRETDGPATAVGEAAAFGAALAAVRGGVAHLVPPQGGLG